MGEGKKKQKQKLINQFWAIPISQVFTLGITRLTYTASRPYSAYNIPGRQKWYLKARYGS